MTACPARRSRAVLTLGALGVVFGDIGTSPLYTLRACLRTLGTQPGRSDVLGLLSLIFWALTMVVTVKYMAFVMRADNHGEGGILALLALAPKRTRWLPVLVIIGAALLYGDGVITPVISVLSAMEGLEASTPRLAPLVLPLTCAVLIALFAIQRRGTGKVGSFFGPLMLIWFFTIGAIGAYHVTRYPGVLSALSPIPALRFFAAHGSHGLLVLGAVVLAVTGAEALYADMGHFSRRPIQLAWMVVVMPALVLSYFGQGAMLLAGHVSEKHLFFAMVPPGPATVALVVLSTCATVIASQALISGAFSLTHQAVQLGLFPRVEVRHTSSSAEGQIYVPAVNAALAVACLALVLLFRSSARLANAYGVAVTGTMVITSIVFFEVTRRTWKWKLWQSLLLYLLFLAFDGPFFVANLFKVADGGYVPILIAAVLSLVMLDWRKGQRIYRAQLARLSPSFETFRARLDEGVVRVPGVAIFFATPTEQVPLVLVRYVERIRALPETVILLTLVTSHQPYAARDASELEDLGSGLFHITITRGFRDSPRLAPVLSHAIRKFDLDVDLRDVTYYFGRETFLATSAGEMSRLAERLFAFLARNASTTTALYRITPRQVVEMGTELDL